MALTLALAALAGAAQAQPAVPAPDYAKAAHWICRPGRDDACGKPVGIADLNPNSFGPVRQSRPAATDPGIDCFAVYPTVSSDRGLNADLDTSAGEEAYMTRTQYAEFASVCRLYVPVYRQMTSNSVVAFSLGQDVTRAGEMAYGDIARAWRHYLTNDNKGRPFVLIGHSQGALMLQQLIAREIEKSPVAARMKLAILPGFNLLVPVGKPVGGTFAKTPLCTGARQVGCALSWSSFREGNVPPPGAMFGHSPAVGMDVACTNPVDPGARGWAKAKSVWFSRSKLPVPGGPVQWLSGEAPPADDLATDGLVSVQCLRQGQASFLAVRTNANPADRRTDRVGGEVGVFGLFLPGWGMHLADLYAVKGNLIDRVAAIGASVRAGAAAGVSAPARPADPLSPAPSETRAPGDKKGG